MDGVPVRIVLRPIGSPLTIGMAGLAIASFVQSGVELSWVSKSQSAQTGLILLAVPFVLQLLASIFSYFARDGAAGAALGVLAVTWLAVGLVDITAGTARTSGSLGLALLAAAAVLACSAAAVSTAKPLPATIFLVTALRFACAGIYQLSSSGVWQSIAGIIGLLITAGATYCVFAFELEDQRRHPVLPTFRRGVGASAIGNGAHAQVVDIENEAGVRQTT